MKTRKNITMANNGSGRKFITKAPHGQAVEREAGNTANPSIGVFGGKTSGRTYDVEGDSAKNLVSEVAKDLKVQFTDAYGEAVETADDSLTNVNSGSPSNASVSSVVSQNSLVDVLAGVISPEIAQKSNITTNNIYRDIFYHDATCGTATELMSTLPFSDFSLSGLRDEKMAKPFVESIESINAVALLPNISYDYIVLGAALCTFTWDDQRGVYTGASPHNIDYATFQHVPVFGFDPVITIRIPEEATSILKDQDLVKKYAPFMPKQMVDGEKDWVLDEQTTIFIPRRSMLKDFRGMSMYRRVLPAWLYEKALIKGTIDQVYKRQRSTTHITIEATEDWQPDASEMQAVANLFMAADLDPLGAVVATRSGINVNEVRRGDDFWRWDQNFDQIERIKLRAMGVSDQFASGDVSYNSMEQVLSVFLEQIREYRARITREVFMDKMFPMIAKKHGFTARKYNRAGSKELSSNSGSRLFYNDANELRASFSNNAGFNSELNLETAVDIRGLNFNQSDYVLPEIIWHKQLKPEADAEYLAMLGTLQENGVPISMRSWIAAGGLSANKLLEGLDDDVQIRQQIADYKKQIAEITKASMPEGMEGDDEGAEEFANYVIGQKLGIGGVRGTSILGRGNTEHPASQFADFDSAGRRRLLSKPAKNLIANRFNKRLAEVAAETARIDNLKTKKESSDYLETRPKFYYSPADKPKKGKK